MPTVDEFDYTFDRLAEIVEKFIAAIDLKRYSDRASNLSGLSKVEEQ